MQPTADARRLDSLTGLRFFAALVVFGSHAVVLVAPGGLRDAVGAFTDQGFVGVSFFYILSGFVLTWSHRENDTASAFYRRRFARIAPTYWACLVLGVLYFALTTGDWVGTVADNTASVIGLQAWVPNDDVYYAGNAVGWSISCELFFYTVFPLLILTTRSRRRLAYLVALAILVIVVTPLLLRPAIDVHDANFWALYIFPAQRLAEFALGIGLAAAMRRGWRSPVSLTSAVVLAAMAYFVAGVVPFWAAVTLVTVVPFALLIAAAATADLEQRRSVLRRPVWVVLGERSFSFYMVHLIVVLCVRSALGRFGLGDHGWAAVGVALALSLVAAFVLYATVEHPFERRLRKARPRASETASA